jgi:SlyX protein
MHEDTERRLTNLEIKASEAEDTLDRLNDVIVRQQGQIDRLLREVAQLHAQLAQTEEASTLRSLRDELPPHY